MSSLPEQVEAWVTTVLDGRPPRLHRAAARREAWTVDGTIGGAEQRLFLRLCHEGDPANSRAALSKETMVVRGLAASAVPVPKVVAVAPDDNAVLFERVDGRSDLHHCPPAQQQTVYRRLLAILDDLHDIADLASLGIDLGPAPATPAACAMNEVESILDAVGGTGGEPLASFGLAWLRQRAPGEVDHVALVHGDAGISNFLFVDDEVTAVIDWEWAHLGDPMEDLGNLLIHSSFFPSGEWPALLRELGERRGSPVDLDRLRYYIAHNLVRSILALRPITARIDARDPLDLNLGYEVLCHRMLCDALAAADGIELERPATPDEPEGPSLLGAVSDRLAEQFVTAPSEVAGQEVASIKRLVDYVDRRQRLGSWLEEAEVADLGRLLGRRPGSSEEGLGELARLVEDNGSTDEGILRYLANRSYRAQHVAAPLLDLVPGVALRPLGADNAAAGSPAPKA